MYDHQYPNVDTTLEPPSQRTGSIDILPLPDVPAPLVVPPAFVAPPLVAAPPNCPDIPPVADAPPWLPASPSPSAKTFAPQLTSRQRKYQTSKASVLHD